MIPMEQVQYMENAPRQPDGQYRPYATKWTHPTLSYGNPQAGQYPPSFQQPPKPQEKKFNLEEMIVKYMQNNDTTIRNLQATVHNLENQIRQMAKSLAERPQGSLPGNTEENPRGEQCKAITLRSGKEVELSVTKPPVNTPIEIEDSEPVVNSEEVKKGKDKPLEASPVPPYRPPVPYQTRLNKDKEDAQLMRFKGMLKQLHINMPLVEVLAQMPKYAKFMKELLSNKKKLEDVGAVTRNTQCLAIIEQAMPKKLNDPGSFVVPCILGEGLTKKALADSG
ncbi:hypothetical protein J5N97_003820 [Dioscorea zingiberensis]|uniref:Uncharacterized protein n=1 Tax=Dioscorea zingiberensis TaxID=325984 RepID=A0A9D5D6I9_9LILI|nr:hypothetical protein J5N97_003820 [Dioscorea zingiberensis]